MYNIYFLGNKMEKCGCKNVRHKQDNYYYNTTEVQENEKRNNEQEKK